MNCFVFGRKTGADGVVVVVIGTFAMVSLVVLEDEKKIVCWELNRKQRVQVSQAVCGH